MARDKIAGRMLLLDEALAEGLPLMFDFLGVPAISSTRCSSRYAPLVPVRSRIRSVKRRSDESVPSRSASSSLIASGPSGRSGSCW
jgi:hypothetical protein